MIGCLIKTGNLQQSPILMWSIFKRWQWHFKRTWWSITIWPCCHRFSFPAPTISGKKNIHSFMDMFSWDLLSPVVNKAVLRPEQRCLKKTPAGDSFQDPAVFAVASQLIGRGADEIDRFLSARRFRFSVCIGQLVRIGLQQRQIHQRWVFCSFFLSVCACRSSPRVVGPTSIDCDRLIRHCLRPPSFWFPLRISFCPHLSRDTIFLVAGELSSV